MTLRVSWLLAEREGNECEIINGIRWVDITSPLNRRVDTVQNEWMTKTLISKTIKFKKMVCLAVLMEFIGFHYKMRKYFYLVRSNVIFVIHCSSHYSHVCVRWIKVLFSSNRQRNESEWIPLAAVLFGFVWKTIIRNVVFFLWIYFYT